MMSLRTRLLRTVMVLLGLGLAASAIATYAAARADLHERANQQLRAAAEQAERLLDGRALTDPVLDLPVPSESAPLWQTVADGGGAPSFFQVRTPDSAAVQTVALGTAPALPSDLAPAAVTPELPDGERFRSNDVEQEGWRTQNWRFRSSWLPDRSGYLVVGMRTTSATDFAGELMFVQSVVTVMVLGVVALLGWRSVRRGMRPLEEIAATAGAIGAGDLTRRVPTAGQPTEISRLATALNAMLGQLETAFRGREASEQRLRQFIADASHELRTPIATIRAYAELFRRGAASRPEELATVLRRIETETERMGLLVDELLLLARLDQGRPLDRVPVDLVALAADAVTAAQAVGPSHPLTLDVVSPVTVTGDPARIRQALDNLLANVRQHTPPGTAATVRVAPVGDAAVLEVCDRGPGLSTVEREQVFERFYRADPARSRHSGGVGLGLAIVAAVASAHGGSATVHARAGGGTAFRLRLPLSLS
jgi:two-component system OmpR family sensor kinase